jgi:hypothetical protein
MVEGGVPSNSLQAGIFIETDRGRVRASILTICQLVSSDRLISEQASITL